MLDETRGRQRKVISTHGIDAEALRGVAATLRLARVARAAVGPRDSPFTESEFQRCAQAPVRTADPPAAAVQLDVATLAALRHDLLRGGEAPAPTLAHARKRYGW